MRKPSCEKGVLGDVLEEDMAMLRHSYQPFQINRF